MQTTPSNSKFPSHANASKFEETDIASTSSSPGKVGPGNAGYGRKEHARSNAGLSHLERTPGAAQELGQQLSIEEPALGAFLGLRVAFIFNASLALAGLVGWEIWTMVSR